MNADTESAVEGSAISLPKGGGTFSGLVPAGRLGVQPHLSLGYSTGSGNGPFGMGWQLRLPGVFRKMSRGVPRYADAVGAGADGPRADVFVLSGAENLVPVEGSHPGRVRYRPRTEGLFARIQHVRDVPGNYWEVRSRDGLLAACTDSASTRAPRTIHFRKRSGGRRPPFPMFARHRVVSRYCLGNRISSPA